MGHVKYSIDRVVQQLHIPELRLVPLFFLWQRKRREGGKGNCYYERLSTTGISRDHHPPQGKTKNKVTRKVLEMTFHYLPLLFLLLQTHFDAVHRDLYIHLPLLDVLCFALVLNRKREETREKS